MAESSERSARNTVAPNRQRERCGDNSRTPPAKLVVIAIVGIPVIADAYIFVQVNRASAPDVSATQVGWGRTPGKGDEQFIFTLGVTREKPELDSYCIIYALNYDLVKVGRRDVSVPGGGPEAVRINTPIVTRELAAVGDVYGCSTDISELLAPAKQPPSATRDWAHRWHAVKRV